MILVVLLFASLIFLFQPVGGLWWEWRAESARQAAEVARQAGLLEAAQDTANLFLDALKNEDGGSAYALLSESYRQRLSLQERFSKKMNIPTVGSQRLSEWKLGDGKLSGDKATFSGSLRSKDGEEHSYRLVVVKEGSFWKGGSWRVELFTVQR
jgi:hypothetical protein